MTRAKVRCRDCYWMEHATQRGVCFFRAKYMDPDLLRWCLKFRDKWQTSLDRVHSVIREIS